jgi:cardiolipin synthase
MVKVRSNMTLAEIWPILKHVWHWSLLVMAVILVVSAMAHLLVHQRDARSAAFWAVIICFLPVVGAIFYVLFGINSLRRWGAQYHLHAEMGKHDVGAHCPVNPWEMAPELTQMRGFAATLSRISRFGFTVGNRVVPLRNGDEAMLAMLEAIKSAQVSVGLCSYIFEAKGIGAVFVEELVKAQNRGVEVRVLVDDAGTRYSFPPVTRILRRQGVTAKRFMPLRFWLRILTMNLRNHRKIMVVDGKIGFTGGMNIRQGNMLEANPDHPVQDMHFRVEGPVVRQLQRVFAEDWAFSAKEVLSGDAWYPSLEPLDEVAALGLPDGPDEDADVLTRTILAAINAAQETIHIMTPYFLPNTRLTWALTLASLRGVRVTVITPKHNNIPFVRWASRTLYPELLQHGVKVHEALGHFDHSKFMLVDGLWSLIGSTNWDPRSLRLNYEFNLACFDDVLAKDLEKKFEDSLANSESITLQMLEEAPYLTKLRDGVAKLFIPFL